MLAGTAEVLLLRVSCGAGVAEPQKKGKTVVWLSAGLGLVSCGFSALHCQSSSVTGWDISFCPVI